MAELITRSADITTLSLGSVINLGSTKGNSLYMDLTGLGFINENSTWQLVQSNDKSNWIAIAGTGFTGENLSDTKNITATHNAVFLGLQLINPFTETAGVITVSISVK